MLFLPKDLSVLLVRVWAASLATYERHLTINNAEPQVMLSSWA